MNKPEYLLFFIFFPIMWDENKELERAD